jgi:surface antigen
MIPARETAPQLCPSFARPFARDFSLALALVLPLALLGACAQVDSYLTGPLYDQLTDKDTDLAVRTMQNTLETAQDGDARRWSNPASGHSGTIRVLDTRVTEGGYFCRDYEETLHVGDKSSTQKLSACRDDDGTWRFAEN